MNAEPKLTETSPGAPNPGAGRCAPMSSENVESANGVLFSLRHWQIWAASLAFWTIYAILDTTGSFAGLALRGERGTPGEIVWDFSEASSGYCLHPLFGRLHGDTGLLAETGKSR